MGKERTPPPREVEAGGLSISRPKIVQLCPVSEGIATVVNGDMRAVVALALYGDGTLRYVVVNTRGEARRPQVVED